MKRIIPALLLLPLAASAADMQGMDMSGMKGMEGMDDMPGMSMPETPAKDVPTEIPKPAPAYPVPSAADQQAAFPDMGGMDMRQHMQDNAIYHQVLIDRLEGQAADGHASLDWEGRAWFGRDLDKLWLRSEGERESGKSQGLQTEAYWGHALGPWWEGLAGIRQDGGDGPSRTWAAFGLQGRTPYFVHAAATVFLGDGSRSALRLEAEDDWLLTQRLILQPQVELNAYGRADPERGVAAGWSDSRVGLRLRYEIRRELAPYVGLEWHRTLGEGQDVPSSLQGGRLVAGIRLWF